MTIFQSAKVTELQGRVSALEAENANLTAQLATANEGLADQTANLEKITALESANAEIPALNQTIETQKAEITGLTEKATITAEKIDAAAAVKLASLGHGEPLKIEGASIIETNSKTITRAEFESLSHKEKDHFILNQGGKIAG